MSDFTGEGFAPFPNLHSDAKELTRLAEWSDEQLEYKTNQYGQFMTRKDIQARAIATGGRILDHCIFELAYRDGVYENHLTDKLEDETCGTITEGA